MATSTEMINSLISGFTDLKAYFEGAKASLVAAQADLPAQLHKTFYVDEVNGLPGNSGTQAEPFEKLDDALDALRAGQMATIFAVSGVVWRKRYASFGSTVRIVGLAGVQNLTFAVEAENQAGSLPGFVSQRGSCVCIFQNMKVTLNPSAAAGDEYFLPVGPLSIVFHASSIVGTGCAAALTSTFGGPLSIQTNATSITDMGGRWIDQFASGVEMTSEATGGLVDPTIRLNT